MYGSIHGFLFWYSSHFQDIHLIQDILFPTFAATNAIIRPRQAAMLMAMRRPVASASHPITGGPTRKPKKLMLETMVITMLALMVPSFPAMLYFVGYFYNLTRSISDRLYLYISHVQQTCTKITIKKSNEGGARAYWQVRIEKMNVFLFRLSSHLSLFWSYFLSNFCLRISLCFGLIIWHEAAMFDIFSNRR